MSSAILVALRIKADPQRVFDVFTNDVAAWWKPNALFQFTPRSPGTLAFEAGEGGRFTETLANGKVFEIGRITTWARPAGNGDGRLAFTWRQAAFAEGQMTHVDVRFEPVGEETRVTIEHRGWESVPQEHVARHNFPDRIFLMRHGEYWRVLLAALQQRAAR